MAFQQGLSGLNAASKSLDVIGNNIANSNTVGFKAGQAQFADVFANSLMGAGGNAIGIGTQIASVAQQFTQGNITSTNNPLDVAINGNGFFRMSNNGVLNYARNGQFQIDASGYIVNSAGANLTGYGVNANGVVVPSNPSNLRVDTSDIAPQASGSLDATINLDARSTLPVTQTQGTLTGTSPVLAFPLTITAATNDTLNVTLNGTAATATIAPGVYNTAASLAAAVQGAINTAFTAAGYSATVTAGANQLTIASNLAGNGSTVAVTGGTAQAAVGFTTVTAAAGANNFNPTDPTSYNNSTSVTLYDSLGNPHLMSLYFVKTNAANGWETHATVDGTSVGNVTFDTIPASPPPGPAAGAPTSLQFNSSGALITPMPITATIDMNAVAAQLGLTNGAAPTVNLTLDLRGTTQFGSIFGVNSLSQDGFASGRLAGIGIGADGMIRGRYSNGQTRDIGQIVLANFNNPQGLNSLGENQWAETSNSGPAAVGAPGTGTLGSLTSASVEDSNVDLTAELVNMITMQRAYQANAQTIKTQDSVLQTLVNLR